MTGKPGYDMQRLQELSVAEMRARLERIDNPAALAIATRLWKQLEWKFSNQYGQTLIRDDYKLRRIAASRAPLLIRRLEALRHVDIGDFIVEGPERMAMALDNLHPLVRLLRPPQRMKQVSDAASWLLHNLEFIENPRRRFPESFVRSWLFGIGLSLSFILPVLLVLIAAPRVANKAVLLLPCFVILVGGMLISVVQLHDFGVVRSLAAYLSFTDEFVNLDSEQEAESGKQEKESH
ncbi:hypothetical protein KDL44_13615 [bacterium]|nr:hypothetical protein [bacterium]